MQKRVMGVVALLLATAMVFVLPATPAFAQGCTGAMADSPDGVVMAGLNAPQGVLVAPDGTVYAVDSGLGGDKEMDTIGTDGQPTVGHYGDTSVICKLDPDGTVSQVATLPSILVGDEAIGGARLAMIGDDLYVTSGGWIDNGAEQPEVLPNTAAVLKVGADGSLDEVVGTWRMESRMNPDNAALESHPYGIVATPDDKLLVADAGANTLLKIDPANGTVELVTTFDPLPGVFPSPTRGGEMLADPVPTGVDLDDEGNAYVSLLSGAPFVPGNAKVVMVTPSGDRSDYATNLTMLTDLRRGPDGNFYAVQFAIFTDQGPTPDSGAIMRVKPGEGSEAVAVGLSFPTSIDFNEAGDAYVTINGVGAPGSGEVVMMPQLTSAAAIMMDAPMAEATPAATEEMMEEPMVEATPAATEEMMEEPMAEATPAATEEMMEEPMAEATPAATEEMMEEPMAEATPAATEEMMEEPMAEATPAATEAMMEEEMTPEMMPTTGQSQPSGVVFVTVVAGMLALLAGGLFMRRRRA